MPARSLGIVGTLAEARGYMWAGPHELERRRTPPASADPEFDLYLPIAERP
jgi:hypothetical protein